MTADPIALPIPAIPFPAPLSSFRLVVHQQLCRAHPQRCCQPHDIVERDVPLTALNAADIRAVDSRLKGQRVL